MPQFLKNKKYVTIAVIILVLIMLYWAYTSFAGSSGSAPLTTTTAATPVSQELLTTLTNLQTITLNSAIFSNPVFLSLTDFGVTLQPQPSGRANPFAPFTFTSNNNTSLSGQALPAQPAP